MNVLNDLLFNVLLLILPIVLFDLLGRDRAARRNVLRNRILFAASNGLSALFCMEHPVELIGGYSFDLRLLPCVIAFLYGGEWPGTGVFFVSWVFQAYLGAGASLASFLSFAIIVPSCWFAARKTHWIGPAPRPSACLLLLSYCLIVTLVTGVFIPAFLGLRPATPNVWVYAAVFSALHLVLMWMIVTLIDYLRTNSVMRQEIIRTEKLTVLSELAASVAHEIRNPMTVARGFMQLLSQPGVPEEKRREYTRMVIEEIDHAEQIVTDYLAFAKPQAYRLDIIDMRLCVEQAAQIIIPYGLNRGVAVTYSMKETPVRLMANFNRLAQAIVNVAKHSIDGTPEGGELRLSLSLSLEKITLDVTDNGPGMTDEEIARLGTPFYDMNKEGTGLSMMVAYRIIESLNGSIAVHSKPGNGTTFTIVLPPCRQPAPPRP